MTEMPPGFDPNNPYASAAAAKAYAKASRPWFKKKRFIIPIAVVVLVGIASLSGGDESTPEAKDNTAKVEAADSEKNKKKPASKKAEKKAAPAPEPEPVKEPVEEAPSETRSQENARKSAESYLDFSAFSRSGLIEQLEFEGFSNADATYAADAVGADWNEQAAKSAENYLDFSSFSRDGLIEQLEFEGYTREQAVYGVNQTGL